MFPERIFAQDIDGVNENSECPEMNLDVEVDGMGSLICWLVNGQRHWPHPEQREKLI